jgi:hypothetical protein
MLSAVMKEGVDLLGICDIEHIKERREIRLRLRASEALPEVEVCS